MGASSCGVADAVFLKRFFFRSEEDEGRDDTMGGETITLKGFVFGLFLLLPLFELFGCSSYVIVKFLE